MRITAAVLREVGKPFQIEELELAPPKQNEVLVKTVASGICHSDYSVRDGTLGPTLPAVLGHEGAGIVEAVGPGVTQLAVGDHVIVSLTPQCGNCVFCKEGKPYLCAQMSRGLTKGLQTDGSKRLKNSRGEEIGQLL
eukprot:gene16104-20579_t